MSNRKKNVVLVSGLIALIELIDTFYLCSSVYNDMCITTKYDDFIRMTLFWISISIFLTSIFTFFISDKIFKKWLKFTFWWFLVVIIWIAISPDSVNFLAIPATKENVSIWMSVGFVIISIIMFIWMSMKGKKE